MKIRICLTKSKKAFAPYSKAIIWYDKVRYGSDLGASHCAGMFFAESWNRALFYHASGKATNFMGEKTFKEKNQIVETYELEVCKATGVKLGQACIDREGTPYAVKQTIGIAIMFAVWAFTLGQVSIENPFADGDKYVNCLEEWGDILVQNTGVEPPVGGLEGISVYTFRNWIRSLPYAKQIEES